MEQLPFIRNAILILNALTLELTEIIEDAKQIKINLSLECQAVRDQRQTEHKEWRELVETMRELIVSIQANGRINRSVLHLITSTEAGEIGDGTEEKEQGRRGAQRTDTKTRGPASH